MSSSPNEAKQYSRVKYLLFVFAVFLDLFILKIFFLSGKSDALRNFSFSICTNAFLARAIYLGLFGLLLYVIHFPLSLFSGFFWEHRYKLSNQKFVQWFGDDLKKNGLGFLLMLLMVEVFYVFLGQVPETWWIWAACFWIFVSFVLARLTPTVIVPLFFKYSTIDNPELKQKIFNVFKNCKVTLKDIYMINLSAKTKKANAFLCGLGKNRRVVLSDTLVQSFTPDEIEVVVAHELGHYKRRDIAKFLILQSVFACVSFFLIDKLIRREMTQFVYPYIDDIALLPMFVFFLTVINIILMPIINSISRLIENQADRFSLEVTHKPKDFISLMEKLATMNLSEKSPNKLVEALLYDHPSIQSRIDFAKTYLQKV